MKREKTATPLQALVLMNDPQFLEASRVLSERLIQEGGESVESKLSYGYRLLTGRYPSDQEIDLLSDHFNESAFLYQSNPKKAIKVTSIGESLVSSKITRTDLAAFTEVISTVMNFDASTMKR